MVERVDRSRPHIWNIHLATKYLYVADTGTSPTKWAYAHPDAPELPADKLHTRQVIDAGYERATGALTYLNEAVFRGAAGDGSRFVDADAIAALAAPPSYLAVSGQRLDVLARWLLQKWEGERPPNYVSDGDAFYLLQDLLLLLVQALADQGDGAGIELTLTTGYGPLEAVAPAGAIEMSAAEVQTLATNLDTGMFPAGGDPAWQVTPAGTLPSRFTTAAGIDINTAQMLYAMSALYATRFVPVRQRALGNRFRYRPIWQLPSPVTSVRLRKL